MCDKFTILFNDIDSQYLYVLDEVERVREHITWMYTYYQRWGAHSPSQLYLRKESWAFMRTNIDYVTQTWANLNTLIDGNDQPELKVLLDSLENHRLIWQTVKTFLENVLQRSEYLYGLKLVV